jgi:NAD(P)-dependent dehydrogenase (short-subunit alcohol dehydrogenase family)
VSNRTVEIGETVQCGWLVFRVLEVGPPVILEGLDFVRAFAYEDDGEARSLYLASDEASFVNGAALPIDGGGVAGY